MRATGAKGIRSMRLDPVPRGRAKLAKAALLLAAFASLAATTRAVLHMTAWRESGTQARALMVELDRSDAEIASAAYVLQQLSVLNIEALRQAANRPGAAGEAARVALNNIRKAVR